MDKEMMRALEADGEKLRQLTGEDHGPVFLGPVFLGPVFLGECMARIESLKAPADCNWPDCGCDTYAMKVIEALLEQGWIAPDLSR